LKAIPVETRKNIIEAKGRGEKIDDIIKWFNVGRRTIFNLFKTYKESGTYVPLPFTGRKSIIFTDEVNERIKLKVKENPSITQERIIEELSLGVTQPALCKHMKKLGLTLKKRHYTLQENKGKMLLREEKNGKRIKKG
jgi:transposase